MARPASNIEWPERSILAPAVGEQRYRPTHSAGPIREVHNPSSLCRELLDPEDAPSFSGPPRAISTGSSVLVHRFCDVNKGPVMYTPPPSTRPRLSASPLSIFNTAHNAAATFSVAELGTLRHASLTLYTHTGYFSASAAFLLVTGDLIPERGAWWNFTSQRSVLDRRTLRITDQSGAVHGVSAVVQEIHVLRAAALCPLHVPPTVRWVRGDAKIHAMVRVDSGVFDLSPSNPSLCLDIVRGRGFVLCEGYTVEIALSFTERRLKANSPSLGALPSALWTEVDAHSGSVYDGQMPVKAISLDFQCCSVSVFYDGGLATQSLFSIRVCGVRADPHDALCISDVHSVTHTDSSVELRASFKTTCRSQTFRTMFINKDNATAVMSDDTGELALYKLSLTGL